MDIRQIRYFLAVVQEGQFTKAAQRLNIAQPPLSQQIKQLEDELGVTLLKRGSRHIELTDAGRVLVMRAEQILELVGSTKKELDDLNKGKQGTVTIGSVSSCGMYLLPKYLYNFHEKFPEATFQVWEGDTYHIMDLIDKGIVDIGIVRTPFNLEVYNYVFQPSALGYDPMVVIYSKEWETSMSKEPVGLDMLKDIPLIVHRRYEQIIVDAFRKLGFEPKILCKGDDTRSLISWAKIGLGVAIIPKPPISVFEDSNIQCKEINDHSLETKTAAIWLKGAYLSPVAKNFIRTIE